MAMLRTLSIAAVIAGLLACGAAAQEAPGAKPTEHTIGTITAADAANHTITVKDDKTAAETKVSVANTRTLLKVEPGAKDLKSATRITANDLAMGDRVDVRGFKAADGSTGIEARSVILMSGRDLAQKHQEEVAAWQKSTTGTVSAVDPAAGTITANVRTPEGPKPLTIQASPSTEFTRYSPENPKTPATSRIQDIQPGDQVRVIGQKNADGTSIAADKVYSGAFRTIAATVTSISADGKQLTVRDLQTKQPVEIALTDESAVRKLPPMMAMGMARRLNPSYQPGAAGASGSAGQSKGQGNAAGAPAYGAKAGEGRNPEGAGAQPGGNAGWQGGSGGMRAGSGDLSRMLERVPPINVSDLKAGDAVVISGAAPSGDKSRLVASSIIAGVEPIFQSAPPRQGQSLGDWSLDMAIPAQ